MVLAVLITLGLSMLNVVNTIVFYAVTGMYPFRGRIFRVLMAAWNREDLDG